MKWKPNFAGNFCTKLQKSIVVYAVIVMSLTQHFESMKARFLVLINYYRTKYLGHILSQH